MEMAEVAVTAAIRVTANKRKASFWRRKRHLK
jgi:hypothetical protein